ncbi:MAG: hypothetical protein J5486_07385 [Bacteroidaceae bacterium]|nr:hypothetical protein [Bacteroidaceae bacterium]
MPVPDSYVEWMSRRVAREVVERFAEGLTAPSPVSIRINRQRLSSDVLPEGYVERVPWCADGCYLSHRPAFTADPLLHAGLYYVQEASSMFLDYVLRWLVEHCENTFNSALDLCAAPGGKSTLLRSVLPPESMLVANETLPKRANVLAENMAKWVVSSTENSDRTVVTNVYPKDLGAFRDAFDLIIADVPCSGEGMFRKEEDAVAGWSPAAVERIAALQRSIISDVWPALRPGGILVYSTCTVNPYEDEDNVEWIASELGADHVSIPVPAEWNVLGDCRLESANLAAGSGIFHHLLPGYVQGEGFFLSVLCKHGDNSGGSNVAKLCKALGKQIKTLPIDLLDTLQDGKSNTPVARVELSLEQAIRYLQRESFVLPSDTPRGIVQVTFQNQRLGLMKNLGSRANNLYPKEWRIRSQHIEPHSLWQ